MSEIQKYRLLRASTHEGVSISLIEHADGDIYKVNEVDKYVTNLKSELSAAKVEIERLRGELIIANAGWDASQNSIGYHIEENAKLKKRVEELEDRIRVSMPYSCDRR